MRETLDISPQFHGVDREILVLLDEAQSVGNQHLEGVQGQSGVQVHVEPGEGQEQVDELVVAVLGDVAAHVAGQHLQALGGYAAARQAAEVVGQQAARLGQRQPREAPNDDVLAEDADPLELPEVIEAGERELVFRVGLEAANYGREEAV